jgi:hypothetical protein
MNGGSGSSVGSNTYFEDVFAADGRTSIGSNIVLT